LQRDSHARNIGTFKKVEEKAKERIKQERLKAKRLEERRLQKEKELSQELDSKNGSAI
jgi:hypothetical protein